MQRRTLNQALLAGLALPHSAATWSQNAPTRLIVGFAAGGSVDLTARALAESMRDSLGRARIGLVPPGALHRRPSSRREPTARP
jgi:tripartite-type tricarboxylate transporter receptor subunit TctC